MTRPLLVALLAACTPDVPATPSFQQDVQPILAANCVRCHGTEQLSAPHYLRLDTYGDLVLREALDPDDPLCMPDPGQERDPLCFPDLKLGAATYAATIAQRIVDDERPMPPRFALDDYQIDILVRWAELGAPRGTPRAGNRSPVARVEAIDGTSVEVFVSDADRDLVGGALLADVGTEVVVIGALAAGRQHLTWDTAGIVPGTYALRAELDDGAGVVNASLGTITVEAP